MPDAKHIKPCLTEVRYAYDIDDVGYLYFVPAGAGKEWKQGRVLSTLQAAGDAASTQETVESLMELKRLRRHVSTLCALLNGVGVNSVLDERSRSIRDTIKKEIGE
jgi:hypothetical protein